MAGRDDSHSNAMRLWVALTLIGASGPSMAATLIGSTVQNQIGGPPLANVQVSAEGSNPARSDSTGRFRLDFPGRVPGQVAKLRFNLPGWVVVNETHLQSLLPANPQDHQVEILLAKTAEREQWALVYYRLRTREIVEAQYQAQLKALTDRQQHTEQEILKLREERSQALGHAEALARQLAQASGKESTAAVALALRLISDRRIDEAFKALEDDILEAEVRKAVEAANNAADGYALRANLRAVRDFNFAGADSDYKKALAIAPDRFEVLLPYALFLQELNRFGAADATYTKAANVARQQGMQAGLALCLNNLGVIKVNRDMASEALVTYEEALRIRRGLAAQQPEQYLPFVAATLNNLGNLHRREGRFVAARGALDESLSIRRDLARRNESLYGPELAKTLANRGSVARDEKRLPEAIQYLSEAIALQRRLAPVSSIDIRPDLARSLNNIGAVYSQTGESDLAFTSYNEALQIRRFLASKNPEAYRPDVATTLLNLGLLQQRAGPTELAQTNLREAATYFQELSNATPEAYRVDLATAHAALAQVEDTPRALAVAALAVQGFESVLSKRPDDKVIRRNLLSVLRVQLSLQTKAGDIKAAEQTSNRLASLQTTRESDADQRAYGLQRGKSIDFPHMLSPTRNLIEITPVPRREAPRPTPHDLCASSSVCGMDRSTSPTPATND